jgi:hypothetical protein
MRTKSVFAALVLGALVFLSASIARAANNSIFRDCSLILSGIDADFLHLSGVNVHADGSLTVHPGQSSVELTAKESFDLMDNAGHVTVKATISSPGVTTLTFTGSGTDFAIARLTLLHPALGRVYTISWSATFDNGGHSCPSAITPQNTGPNPFVITVSNQ